MTEQLRTFACSRCRHIFKVPANSDKETKCPVCGFFTGELVSWKPIGFDVVEEPMWEYECQDCRNVFKRRVPDSPTQEKEIKCPACGRTHIHRLTALGGEPLYCG
jgi:putative FmdB family regulatory protein